MNVNRIIKVRPLRNPKKVLYIMHNAFRVKNNHSLFHALSFQKELQIILVHPIDTNERTITFFEKGIQSYEETLKNYAKKVLKIHRENLVEMLFRPNTHVVMDMYYLKEEKELYDKVLGICDSIGISLDLVETNTLIPVTEASNKEEYSAKTIRTKIHNKIDQFLDSVLVSEKYLPVEREAFRVLTDFIDIKLPMYHYRNDPSVEYGSMLSAYLKYGFLSPLTIYTFLNEVVHENKEAFLEELIVRRELAYNFVYFNKRYYEFEHITYGWAYSTMENHLNDQREYLYTINDYLNFNTHDAYFNTAMKEMVFTGYMHGYMRMYWCKKIIEWSETYEEAYKTAIFLNNYYFLDGNTPNGYTGVAWCFGKHDRAWKEREVFGKLRYMNKNGLERKFDMEEYVSRIERKVKQYNE